MTSIHLKIIDSLISTSLDFRELCEDLDLNESRLRSYINDITSIDEIHFSNFKHGMNYIKEHSELREKIIETQDFLPNERKLFLYLHFLFFDRVNLNALSRDIGVSRRTLFNDLTESIPLFRSCGLTLAAKNAKGVFLEGNEIYKRFFFPRIFLKYFTDRKYLPKKFSFVEDTLNRCNGHYPVAKIAYEIVTLNQKYYNNLVDMSVQGALYSSIIRREFSDLISLGELNKGDERLCELDECIGIKNILDMYNFLYTSQEFVLICKISNPNLLKVMENSLDDMEILIRKLQEKLEIRLDLSPELNNCLLARLNYMSFKKEFQIKEFYNINQDINSLVIGFFNKVSEALVEIFEDINSTDKIAIFYIVITVLESELGKYRGILLYHGLPLQTLSYAFHNLKYGQKFNLLDSVPLIEFPEYLERHDIDYIISFENIDIPKGDYGIIKLKLPLTTLDLSKIIKILQK